ncbi:MAG: DUF4397 domain-containing protein [Myxococcota bacterium]
MVHASPDPSLATLDVYANGRRADDLPFGQATGVFKVAMNQRVDIAPADSTGTNSSLALAPPPAQPSRVLLVVRGVLGTGFDTSVNDTTLTLDSVEGYLEEPSSAGALELLLYHAVPDAPAVSVGLQESPDVAAPSPLFSNVGYGGFSGYEAGALGTNPLDVYAASSGVRVASVQTSSGLALPASEGFSSGAVALVATGFLDPMANMGGTSSPGAGLQVLAVFADGTVRPLDAAARLQLVHASVEAPTSVDVYLAEAGATSLGTLEVNNLGYQSATPFRSYVSGVPVLVQLTEGSSTSIAASVELTPEAGVSARWVAVGDPAGGAAPLTVVSAASDSEVAVGTGIDVQLFHASTDAGEVDVHFHQSLSPGPSELSNPVLMDFAYATPTATLTGETLQDFVVSLTAPNITSMSLVDFNTGLTTFSLASSGESVFFLVMGSASGSAADLDLVVVGNDGRRGDPINGQ